MSGGFSSLVPQVHVHRVRPIEVGVEIDGRDVGGVEGVRVIRAEPYPTGLRVLPQPVQCSCLGQMSGDFEILVLEDHGAVTRIEQRLPIGFPPHREREWIGGEAEDEIAPCVLRRREGGR